MSKNLSDSVKNRLSSYRVIWGELKFEQKISLVAMFFLLFALPVGILLMIKPTRFFSFADFPITPPTPTILPITPTTTVAITQAVSPTLTVPPTQTPGPTRSISTTPTLFPTISIVPPTPTVVPPANNLAPRVITSRFKSGSVGKYLEREIQAEDRNGDQLTLTASNLPPGLIFADCSFIVKGNGALVMTCVVNGTPTQFGIFASGFVARDVWGAETRKTIYFTILP